MKRPDWDAGMTYVIFFLALVAVLLITVYNTSP